MPLRDVVSWNSMINCYATNLCLSESVDLFRKMHFLGYVTKPELVASVLSVCARSKNLKYGREIHGHAIRSAGFESGVLLPTALVDMYSKCGDLDSALSVFGLMSERNEVSWTAMITGCVVGGDHSLSFELFRGMVEEGVKPNRVTLISVLRACGEFGALRCGKEVHGYVLRHDFDLEPRVIAALIDMYCKFKQAFHHALFAFEQDQFKDVVTWSLMMMNSTRHGDNFRTMELFNRMKIDGVKPNSVTMLAMLLACAGLSSMDHGQGIHCYILKSGLLSDVFIGNSLIDMYAKCGCLASAVQTFYEMPIKDSVSYTCMISGYGIHGHGYEALRLFYEMKKGGIRQDSITFLAILSACNQSGLIDKAEEVFCEMKELNGDTSPLPEHYACYVDLLGRSGMVEDAYNVIRTMSSRPSPKLLSSVVLACRISGKFELAESLALQLLDLEPENAANYMLLSMIHAETGNWIGKERVLGMMRDRGLVKTSGSSQIEL
ncbi:TPR-like protein [Dioscorea alata]|uniref:TPR-like protein n=1 Tax=Dioscorea alata TaxID=55571 RepID=A0ACB7VD12_DIOAL|nr:TPR-like protein [Dioscorea alata]